MESDKNLPLKKVPTRLENIIKGLLLILLSFISIPATGGAYVFIGFFFDLPIINGSFNTLLLEIFTSIVFLVIFIGGIFTVIKAVRKTH
ncbi:MAG: hypothetical protein WCG97_00785 [bacterium]